MALTRLAAIGSVVVWSLPGMSDTTGARELVVTVSPDVAFSSRRDGICRSTSWTRLVETSDG